MTALIMKDIANLKKTLLLTVAICAALAGYGIYENAIFMIPLICVMIPLMLTAIAFGYDTKAKFEQFAFSMPVKKGSYVLSKLFFAFTFGIFGSICMFVLLMLNKRMPTANIVFISLITMVASVLISAIQLPFILKYGAEKGRLIMIITNFAIFGLSTLLKEKLDLIVNLMEIFSKYSMTMICSGIIAVSLIVIGIAIKLSVIIMEKKEY